MSSIRPTPMPARVGLVDDHEVVGLALEAALRDSAMLRFVGVSSTVDALLSHHDDLDLVVLDLRLADGSSPVRNVERLVELGLGVVAFTSGENPYLVRMVARTAVLGIVRKSAPISLLVETLEQGAHGHALLTPEWAAAIDSDPALPQAELSPKEQQVLALFATGLKAQAVAAQAGIAVGTVDDYVRRIRLKYARIGRPAPTKIDLYKRAVEDGFLPLPESGG